MARLPRLFIPAQPQHVILRGNNGQPICRADADRRALLDRLRDAARQHGLAIHAYCLMPNHLHLVATPSDGRSLPATLQSLGRHYVLYFNRKHGRTGTLWEGRYRATVIEAERYLLDCMRYVELNPMRAGLVERPEDYAWSSCAHHAGLIVDALVTDHSLYWALGNTPFERQRTYQDSLSQPLSDAIIQAIRDATQKGWVLGSETYMTSMAIQANRRIAPLTRGRPRRQVEKSDIDSAE